jgi:uracil-DNA glycosylase
MNDDKPKIFVAWGNEALSTISNLNNINGHKVVTAGHPASGAHGKDLFSGCRHFSIINKFLEDNNLTAIEWRTTNT